jgi:micrococcal nuclease
MARRPRRRAIQLSLPILLLLALAYVLPNSSWQGWRPSHPQTPSSPAEGEWYTVERVVDGDTLEITVNGQEEKVRLIRVDTPEKYDSDKLRRDASRTGQDEQTINELGHRASEFTESLVPEGSQVRLEYDQQSRDQYNRLLAFVWLLDGRMLNEMILCDGYANALTRYPFHSDYMERFRACERQARGGEKGRWGAGLVPQSTTRVSTAAAESAQGAVRGNRQRKIYHLPECPDYQRLRSANIVPFKTEAEAVQAGYRKAKTCP